jgi:hypothetical protein
MSKKDVHIRLEGRGHFEDVVKDMDADLVIAYIMNFGEEATDTDIAMVGSHTIGNKTLAAQLGRITASMLVSAFAESDAPPVYWRKFEDAFRSEISKAAKNGVRETLRKLEELLDKEDDKD